MADNLADDAIMQAVSAAKAPSSSNEPIAEGRILPYKKYADGTIEFDPSVGLLGGITRALTAPGRAMKGEIPTFEVNEEGETVPSQKAIDEAMNVAGQVMLGSAPSGVAQTLREGFDPNVIRTFAGASSKTADLAALDMAQNLEAKGMDRDFIWKHTGWGRNPAGQWFYEIPDNELRIRPLKMENGVYVPRESTFGAEVHHPEAYEAYPDLRDMKFTIGDEIKGYGGSYYYPTGPNFKNEKIAIGPEDAREVLAHELGHAVAYRENFPRGGNPSDPALIAVSAILRNKATVDATNLQGFKQKFINDYVNSLNIPQDDVFQRSLQFKIAQDQFKKMFPLENARLNQAYTDMNLKGSKDAYSRLAGEIQPNIAMKSIDWSPIVRREIAPWNRDKTPYTSQVVRTQQGDLLLGKDLKSDGGRTGYASKGKVKEDDNIRSALDIARQMEDPANRIEADIRGLTQNLSGFDISSAFPSFHTGLPQRPQVGGAGLLPPRPSNEYLAKTVALEELAKAAGMTPREYGERFTSLKKPATPFEEWQYTQQQNAALTPRKIFDPNQMKVGDVIIPFVGDLTSAGQKVTNINQRQLGKPLLTEGGESYMRATPDIWASGQSIISALNNRAQRAIEVAKSMGNKEPTAYGFHVGMDPMAGDFSTHTAEGILGLLPSAKIKAADAKKFDQFMKTPTSEFKGFKDWPGLKSEKLHDYLMEQGKGAARIKFSKGMDKAEWRDLGFPDVGPARFASTETILGGLPTGATGTSIGRLASENAVSKAPESIHRSYPVSLRGEYVGGLVLPLERDLIFKDWSDRFNANPPERNFISAKNKSYANKDAYQIVTNRWLDTISKALEDAQKNKAEGGRTMGNNAVGNALRMARDHFDYGGDVRGGDSPFMSRSDYGLREAPTPSFRQAEDRSMREYNRAVESGWSPTSDRGGGGGGASAPSTSPESQLTGRQSGFEGAPSVAMPSSIGELLAYNRNVRLQQQQSQQQQQAEQEATDQRIRDALAMAGVGATKFGDASALASGFPSVAKQSVFWGGEPQGPSAATIDRAMALSQMPNVMGLPAGTILSRTELPTQAEYYGAPQETPEQMFARSNFGSPQINAQFASASSPYAVTPSAPQTMFAGTQPAFPHTPTPQQVAQVASAPDVRASFVQPNRPITLTPQPTIEQLTQTPPQQVAQNVPLPPTVARDPIAAAVAAASSPVQVAQATDPLLQNPDALVLSGRKAAQTVPMPLARPTDLPRPGLFDQIRADLDFATGQRINELEAAKQYAGGSPEQVAAAIGVNPSDLRARIVNYDGQPKVDYYTKDLSQALFGDPLNALGAGIGSLFGAKTGDQQVAEAVAAAREGGGGRGQQQAEVAPAVTVQTAPPPYTTELSAGNLALPSTSGLTAEQWAAQNAGGDMSRVHARIKYVNGAPMLEYYTV